MPPRKAAISGEECDLYYRYLDIVNVKKISSFSLLEMVVKYLTPYAGLRQSYPSVFASSSCYLCFSFIFALILFLVANMNILSLLTTPFALASCEISNTLFPLLGTARRRVLDFGVIVEFGIVIRELGLW